MNSRTKKKITKTLKQLVAKLSPVGVFVKKHPFQIAHTAMLTALIIRVEQMHDALLVVTNTLTYTAFMLSVRIQAAQDQFGAAIQSIVSLFGGEAS